MVLIVVVVLTLKVLMSVKLSPISLPNTAAPVMVKLCVLPTTVPPVVMVVTVNVVSAPMVTLSL